MSPRLLLIDEMGCISFGDMEATVFSQLVSKRYEKGLSIILTSNQTFGEWDSIFGDQIIATAILDHLLHRSTTINMRRKLSSPGNSEGPGYSPPPVGR